MSECLVIDGREFTSPYIKKVDRVQEKLDLIVTTAKMIGYEVGYYKSVSGNQNLELIDFSRVENHEVSIGNHKIVFKHIDSSIFVCNIKIFDRWVGEMYGSDLVELSSALDRLLESL